MEKRGCDKTAKNPLLGRGEGLLAVGVVKKLGSVQAKALVISIVGKSQKIVGADAEIAGKLKNCLGARLLFCRFPIAYGSVAQIQFFGEQVLPDVLFGAQGAKPFAEYFSVKSVHKNILTIIRGFYLTSNYN